MSARCDDPGCYVCHPLSALQVEDAERVYRRCSECGKEWTEPALIAAHNAWLDQWDWEHVGDRVTDPAAVHCCPECIHDW